MKGGGRWGKGGMEGERVKEGKKGGGRDVLA